jgi:predicted RNase H-like HicB family nuclease
MAGDSSVRGVADASPPEASNVDVRLLRDAVEAAVEELHGTLATLQLVVVDGYFVKVWQDWESGEWVADCPTVRTVAQENTRDEVVEGIRVAITGMLDTLRTGGFPVPARDL